MSPSRSFKGVNTGKKSVPERISKPVFRPRGYSFQPGRRGGWIGDGFQPQRARGLFTQDIPTLSRPDKNEVGQ